MLDVIGTKGISISSSRQTFNVIETFTVPSQEAVSGGESTGIHGTLAYLEDTETRSGENPLLTWYKNASVLVPV